MLIEPLLGYKSTWRILNLLFETPRKPVSRPELLHHTKLGNAPLSKGLSRLVAAEILSLEKRGKKEFYYINESNQYAVILKTLWEKERKDLRILPYKINLILSEFIRGLNETCREIKSIILFGSHAKGTASIHSDLDLAVIFKKNLEEELLTRQVASKLEKKFKTSIQIHPFTNKFFQKKNNLINEIKNDGINLLS